MKTPRTIKALAVVKKNNPKLSTKDIYYSFDDVHLNADEAKCQVTVIFEKYIK